MSDAGEGPHDVGSFAEEAARLLGAMSGWAREHAGEATDGLSGLADHAVGSAHDLNDHFATGSAECTVCPVCRTVHAVRQLSPEVKAHLASAAASLAQAATTFLATHVPADETPASDVEHIELDDEWPEDG